MNQRTTLILGGTGKSGRRVAARLDKRGIPFRVASRKAALPFDWTLPHTWAPALAGVRALYIAYQPDLAAPGASERVRGVVQHAVLAGVERIVLLSGRGEPGVLPSERAVAESGVPFTIIRGSWFAQNFSEGHLADGVAAGELAFPGGTTVAEPFVDVEDIADVAAAALTDERHSGKIYELTGPRLLTFAEAVSEISAAAGREIRYVPITTEQYAEAIAPYLPADEVTFLTTLFHELLDGHNAHVTNGIELALGRKARDFREYARNAAAAGAWSRPQQLAV